MQASLDRERAREAKERERMAPHDEDIGESEKGILRSAALRRVLQYK